MTYYVQPHRSQYEPDASTITRRAGCTWTTGANGVGAVTGGSKRPSPDDIKALLPNDEETSPGTLGWSIPDLVHALAKIGIVVVDHSGEGWDALTSFVDSGHYVALQGDSDQFSDATCSGAFDGDHCIGLSPKKKLENGIVWRWVDDPICSTGRWEQDSVLRRYASDLSAGIRFAVFVKNVPQAPAPKPPAPSVILRYGAKKLAKPAAKRIRVPAGRKANVRVAPRTTSRVKQLLPRGSRFVAYQVTDKGQSLAGSSRWYGNRTGTRWVHSSSF